MFKELASQLNIFKYITFRASYAAVTALVLALVLGPLVIRWLKKEKMGQVVRDDGPKTHKVKSGTPTMGGIFIIAAIVMSVLMWQDLRNGYTWITLLAILGFGAIGFADDYLKFSLKNTTGLKASYKMAAQLVVSAAIVLFIYFNRNN